MVKAQSLPRIRRGRMCEVRWKRVSCFVYLREEEAEEEEKNNDHWRDDMKKGGMKDG